MNIEYSGLVSESNVGIRHISNICLLYYFFYVVHVVDDVM